MRKFDVECRLQKEWKQYWIWMEILENQHAVFIQCDQTYWFKKNCQILRTVTKLWNMPDSSKIWHRKFPFLVRDGDRIEPDGRGEISKETLFKNIVCLCLKPQYCVFLSALLGIFFGRGRAPSIVHVRGLGAHLLPSLQYFWIVLLGWFSLSHLALFCLLLSPKSRIVMWYLTTGLPRI